MIYRECKKLNEETNYKEIEQALEINNKIWNVKSSLNEFILRAKNSHLVALFENAEILGTISGILLNKDDVLNNKIYHTWNGITDNGTFNNVNKEGNALCCVAITSSKSKSTNEESDTDNRLVLSKEFINQNIGIYINSNLDPVINFHKKDKGIIKGAKVLKIFPNGRPEDKLSLGFNILMQYPKITDELRAKLLIEDIDYENMSAGKALILGAVKEAIKNKNISYIMPYSRPVKYRYYLMRVLRRLKGDNFDFENEKEEQFYKAVLENM